MGIKEKMHTCMYLETKWGLLGANETMYHKLKQMIFMFNPVSLWFKRKISFGDHCMCMSCKVSIVGSFWGLRWERLTLCS
jgi:hypothetical protein